MSEADSDQIVETYYIRVWRGLAPTDTLELAVAIGAQTSAIFACGDWELSLETRFSTPDRSRPLRTLSWNINGQSGDDRQMPMPSRGTQTRAQAGAAQPHPSSGRGKLDLLPRTVGERISVSTDLADDLWMTLADRGEIDCAVLNLVANARDAMPKGGAIQIATSNVALDAPRPCVANSLSVSMRGK